MGNRLKDNYILILLGFLFITLIAIPRISFPDLDHGDEFSDASVLMAGKNFIKFGFIKCRFLPFSEPHLDKPTNLYTHAPPMSDITNGLLRKVFKTDSLRFFRGVALFFSLLNILFWYLFVKKFSGSFLIGFLAAIFCLTNTFFIYGVDSLYQNAYSDFLRAFIFYVYIILLTSSNKRKIGLILIFLLFALETLYTFEYIVYLALFLLIFKFFYREPENKLSIKYIFLLFLAPILIIILHFLQNVWYFGSFNSAFQDLKNIALERIAHSKDSPLGALSFSNWWNNVFLRYISLAFLFNFYILIPFIFFFFALYQNLSIGLKKEIRRIFYLCLLLLVCGISWYVMFPSHALAHTFILFLPRHLVPSATLTFALCCYIMYCFIKEHNPRNIFGKAALGLIIIVIALSGILNSELVLTKSTVVAAKDFLEFKKCLLKVKQEGQETAGLGVNYYRFPFIRYYTNRQCTVVFNKADLEALPSLPEYFILIFQNNPANYELYQFLNQKYNTLFTCNSLRFPSLFFKLKKE